MITPLFDKHRMLGAKFVEFAGWKMPLQYKGTLKEHLAVRSNAGIFDVSHMGRIEVIGNGAEQFLDYLSTNLIEGKPDFSATYTVWANELGGCLDDLIVYKQNSSHFFIVANASNRQKDLDHLIKYAINFDVKIVEKFSTEGILAIQGPKAIKIAKVIFPDAPQIHSMQFSFANYKGQNIILSGTGYTGAGGLEIYAPQSTIVELWDLFLKEGQSEGIQPAGLGARDTLRLEMGYALYGHELNESISPNETVSHWTVRWKKKDFLGKTRMSELQKSPLKRSEYGIILCDKGIAREGQDVYRKNQLIGKVTSGSFSPCLNTSIAIILVNRTLENGDLIELQIRQNRIKAEVASLPFLKIKDKVTL
jgi:aminomethyltransferase